MKLLFFAGASLVLALSAPAQIKPDLTDRQCAKFDSIATQDVPPRAPGIATCVVINGKVVYKKCAGYANLTDSALITPRSRFNIASNGKQFTALAVLLLIEQKKLTANDDIRKFFPALFPDIHENITVKNLLTHTSGIRDVYDLWSLQGITWWKKTFSNQDALTLLQQQRELNFKPGTAYRYSNSNYILLALLVEKVSEQSFVAFTNTMFQKLNMSNTSFESDYRNIRGPIARPYFNFDTWSSYNWISNLHGDGNLFSTLEDQLTWEKTLQTRKNKSISTRVLETCQTLAAPEITQQYGYGLEFGLYNGIPYQFHEGATGAWKATVVRFPDQNVSIVTLTNSGKTIPAMQTRQLADVALRLTQQTKTFPVKPSKTGSFVSVNDVVGVYQNDANFTFTFEKRDTSLFLLRSGRNDIRLERESANIFHQWNDPDFKQEFTLNNKQELEVTAYYTTHAPYTLTRANADWSGFDANALNGTYKNTETGVTLQVTHAGDLRYALTVNNEQEAATLITPHKLLFANYAVELVRDDTGKVTTLLLSGDRINAVRFIIIP